MTVFMPEVSVSDRAVMLSTRYNTKFCLNGTDKTVTQVGEKERKEPGSFFS